MGNVEVRIVTWNVRSKSLAQADDLVDAASRVRKWDFVCLQEVAREGDEVHRRLRGGHLLFVAPCCEGAWSVGVVVHREWLKFVVKFEHRRRCCWVSLKLNTREGAKRVVVGSVHLPHARFPDEAFIGRGAELGHRHGAPQEGRAVLGRRREHGASPRVGCAARCRSSHFASKGDDTDGARGLVGPNMALQAGCRL